MTHPFIVRDYEPGDEHQILELLELVFKGWPQFEISCTPMEYWRWKYLDNPYGKSIIPVVTVGDKVVCTNNGLTRKIRLFGKTLLSSQGTDLSVHPDYRRTGIYTRVSEIKSQRYREDGFSLTWAVTANPVVFDTNIAWGRGGSPHKVSSLIRVNDIDLHFKMKGREDDLVRRIGAKILKGSGILDRIRTGGTSKDNREISLVDVQRFDDDYPMFFEKACSSYDMIFERSLAYMNWRYVDRRAGGFKVIAAKAGSEWLGYVVYKVNRYNEGYPEAWIADVLAPPEQQDIALALVEEVGRRMDEAGVNATYSWAVEGSPYLNLLQKAGYLNSRYHPYFIFQNINLSTEWDDLYKIKPGKMSIQYGDSDWA